MAIIPDVLASGVDADHSVHGRDLEEEERRGGRGAPVVVVVSTYLFLLRLRVSTLASIASRLSVSTILDLWALCSRLDGCSSSLWSSSIDSSGLRSSSGLAPFKEAIDERHQPSSPTNVHQSRVTAHACVRAVPCRSRSLATGFQNRTTGIAVTTDKGSTEQEERSYRSLDKIERAGPS